MRKRNKTISIRCTETEYEKVHQRTEKHGLKLNEFILKTALGRKIIVAEGLHISSDRISRHIKTSVLLRTSYRRDSQDKDEGH